MEKDDNTKTQLAVGFLSGFTYACREIEKEIDEQMQPGSRENYGLQKGKRIIDHQISMVSTMAEHSNFKNWVTERIIELQYGIKEVEK